MFPGPSNVVKSQMIVIVISEMEYETHFDDKRENRASCKLDLDQAYVARHERESAAALPGSGTSKIMA